MRDHGSIGLPLGMGSFDGFFFRCLCVFGFWFFWLFLFSVFFRRTRSSVWSCCSKKLLSFRFLASWITHNDFQRLVRSNWNPFIPWNDLLNNFRRELQRWNKEGFGNIFFLEKKLIKRLDKLNWQLGGGGNVHSIDVFFLLCGRNMRKFCFKKRFYGSKNLALSGLPLVIVIVVLCRIRCMHGSWFWGGDCCCWWWLM